MNDNAQPLFQCRYLNFASYVDRTIMVRTIRNTICDSSSCPQSSCQPLIRGPFESMICARLSTNVYLAKANSATPADFMPVESRFGN